MRDLLARPPGSEVDSQLALQLVLGGAIVTTALVFLVLWWMRRKK